jgi:hypothetical protein
MPHVLDNSIVNLDILPEGKAQKMADKAQEGASEGASTARYVQCLLLLILAFPLTLSDANILRPVATSHLLPLTSRALTR